MPVKRGKHRSARFRTNETQKLNIISPNFNIAKEYIECDNLAEFIQLLNESKINVNDIGEIGGQSLLMIACEYGNESFAQEIIRRGADINYQDKFGFTSLISAVREDQIDIVAKLLDEGAKIDTSDEEGWTALMWSSYKGYLDVTNLLLKKGASTNVYDNHHITPLIWASGRGYLQISISLLAHAAKPDAGDKYGTTPLIWACRKGYIDIAQKLLKSGANVDSVGMFGWTPLLVAVRGNYEALCELIVTYKPNINVCDSNGLSPLMTACKEGNINIVNTLLHANSYVNLHDKNGDTCLIHASKAGFVLIVEALIKAHADVDYQGADKKTALYWAVEKGHSEVVRAILKANPNLELSTRDGDTPLLKAVRCRRLQIVKYLMDKKSKVSATDKYGDSALHIAIRAQSKAIVEFLLRNPRNTHLLYKPNKRGETAFALDNAHQKPLLPTLFGATPSSQRVLEKETQLGYDLYSSAIANLLSEPTLKLPICIGLFAKWGSGKSFLIGRLKDDLISLTKDWTVKPIFRFTWSLFFGISMLSVIVAFITFVATNGQNYTLALILMIVTFLLCFVILEIIYCGHIKYDWSTSANLRSRLDRLMLIIKMCFGQPPILECDQISTLPVRFLFTEVPVKISSDYTVCEMISSILTLLWSSIENQMGFLPTRLYKVFMPKHVYGPDWRWRKVCMMPIIFLVILSFFAFATLFVLFSVDKTQLFKNHPISYILVAFSSVLGAWFISNITVPFKIIRQLLAKTQKKSREELSKEVELMHSCLMCLDAFDGTRQSRLVIFLDALESIYESDRLISILESINVYFINCGPVNYHRMVPHSFVVILSLDPHHRITSKSKEYLKTIVHLPFYLQNSQLRRVRIPQIINKNDYRSSTTSLIDGMSASLKNANSNTMIRKSKKGTGILNSADSVISLGTHPGESMTKVLLTDDYFSDVNPKSMRRIMNIVYIEGRLLKAFNLDFDSHRLTTWVNISEQWPLRATALITYFEIFESKYNDDNLPLKTIYDKISNIIPQDANLNSVDNDEKKLKIFLSFHHNSLTVGDLRIFAPFTINIDPYLKKYLQEAWSAVNLLALSNVTRSMAPSSNINKASTASSNYQVTLNSSLKYHYSNLSVDGVISLLKQIDSFDLTKIDKYSQAIRANNINGKVLVSCTQEDFNDLKAVLGFSFGDWLLFKKIISEGSSLSISNIGPQNSLILPSMTSDLIRMQTNLEKQVTMEETALASAVVMDSPIEEEELSPISDPLDVKEVGILYLSGQNFYNRVSPSVSFGDSEHAMQINQSHIIDIDPDTNESTPLVSPSKNSVISSSSSSSRKHPLERQGNVEPTESFV